MIDAKVFNTEINQRWNSLWAGKKFFRYRPGDEKAPLFVIDTPPPFTSGELHMGQAFWVCYIDSLARYKHLRGFNVLYPQGWDTQGFPTEMAVEKKFGKGLDRRAFYERCAEVANANIAVMKAQMDILGASYDPSREYVTMSEDYRAKVQLSLLIMGEKGFVYRAKHPVEWCSYCATSIAREETLEKDSKTILNYIRFGDAKQGIEIATTRPEYLHACVAIAVNPDDSRFKKLVGKRIKVPLFGKSVKVIADSSIEKDFGTGAEMVCTFGDKNDAILYYRHGLELIEAMDEKGLLINAGEFSGKDAKKARIAIVDKLKAEGLLLKQETTQNVVKIHDKCKNAIEIRSAMQWFIKTKERSEEIKRTAAQMKWIPDFTRQRLDDWANFVEWDWNISRRRVFGTPIPFWYCERCGKLVPADRKALPVNPALEDPPAKKCECGGDILGEQDTCDCWVDSSITPLVIAGWPDDKKLLERAFPASLRIQGTDIIRTWTFYTVARVGALTGNKPFEKILAHGMILGTDGKEMHKSEGNGISPQALVERYPVDAIRLWVALSGGIGKDRPFSYEEVDYAKNFLNKLYNSALFVKKATEGVEVQKLDPKAEFGVFDLWILNRFNTLTRDVTKSYDDLNLYEAMSRLINFYWHEFADYYLENVKHRMYSEQKQMRRSKEAAAYVLRHVLLGSLRMFAPVLPYISEEVHALFFQESIFAGGYPEFAETVERAAYAMNGLVFRSGLVEADFESAGAFLNNIIADVRKFKASNRLALNKEISSININVPEEYYSTVSAAAAELKGICKAGEIGVQRSKDYSVSVKV